MENGEHEEKNEDFFAPGFLPIEIKNSAAEETGASREKDFSSCFSPECSLEPPYNLDNCVDIIPPTGMDCQLVGVKVNFSPRHEVEYANLQKMYL